MLLRIIFIVSLALTISSLLLLEEYYQQQTRPLTNQEIQNFAGMYGVACRSNYKESKEYVERVYVVEPAITYKHLCELQALFKRESDDTDYKLQFDGLIRSIREKVLLAPRDCTPL